MTRILRSCLARWKCGNRIATRNRLPYRNRIILVCICWEWGRRNAYYRIGLNKPKLTISQKTSNCSEAWVKIKIEGKMEHWFIGDDVNDTQHIIEVRCATCEPHPSISLLRLDHDYRPFIVVNTYSGRPMRRPKRNINCSATTTSCCRDSLYISFAEIGWNDWILQPPGYHAYFCRGSCASAASITLSDAYYNTAIRVSLMSRPFVSCTYFECIRICFRYDWLLSCKLHNCNTCVFYLQLPFNPYRKSCTRTRAKVSTWCHVVRPPNFRLFSCSIRTATIQWRSKLYPAWWWSHADACDGISETYGNLSLLGHQTDDCISIQQQITQHLFTCQHSSTRLKIGTQQFRLQWNGLNENV